MFNGVRCYSLRGWVGTDHHCAATLQEFIEGAAKLRGSAKALDIWRMETKIEAMAAGFSGPAAGDNMSFWPQHLYHWCQLQVFDILGPHVCCALTNCNQTTIVRFP